jgi:hypothetical protein
MIMMMMMDMLLILLGFTSYGIFRAATSDDDPVINFGQ